MARLGKITLQATDDSDIFLSEDIFLDGEQDASEQATEIIEPDFDLSKAYISGSVKKEIAVSVDGDTSVIYAWFKSDTYPGPFRINIYIIYEVVEEIIENENL